MLILQIFKRKFAIFRCDPVAALVPADIATVRMLSRNAAGPQVVSESELDCVTKACCCNGSLAFLNSATTECNCNKKMFLHTQFSRIDVSLFSPAGRPRQRRRPPGRRVRGLPGGGRRQGTHLPPRVPRREAREPKDLELPRGLQVRTSPKAFNNQIVATLTSYNLFYFFHFSFFTCIKVPK